MARTKYGGRKKGTPNKSTNTELKTAIEEVSIRSIKSLLEDFDSLTTQDKVKIISTSLKYVLPQLKSVETTLDTSDNIPKWVTQILNDEYKSDDK